MATWQDERLVALQYPIGTMKVAEDVVAAAAAIAAEGRQAYARSCLWPVEAVEGLAGENAFGLWLGWGG